MRDGYYKSETSRVGGRKPQKNSSTFVWSLLDWIMIAVTLLCAVALLCALLAGVVNPNGGVLFAFAGLFYQLIWVANLFCALWWGARWKKYFFLPLVMVLVGAGTMGLFYRSDVSTKPAEVDREKNDLVVVSYNVMNFSDDNNPEEVANWDRVIEWVNEQGADILLLQEAHFSVDNSFAKFKEGVKKMPYGYFHNSESAKNDLPSGSGFVLMSAYPIVKRGVVCADSLLNHSLWADLRVGRDTIRVVNNHLESTGITQVERNETLSHHIVGDSMAHKKLTDVVVKMKENYQIRAEQAEQVAAHIENSPHPVIVGGDFNDTPQSYVYRTIKRTGLIDAFDEKGRGVEHTFIGLFNLFRIDYIMASEEYFVVKEYASHDVSMSDHKPVVVRLGVAN